MEFSWVQDRSGGAVPCVTFSHRRVVDHLDLRMEGGGGVADRDRLRVVAGPGRGPRSAGSVRVVVLLEVARQPSFDRSLMTPLERPS